MANDYLIAIIVKELAVRRSRRTALRIASVGIASSLAVPYRHNANAQSTPPTDDAAPAFLFAQTATSGAFMPNAAAGSGADYLLTLEAHHGGTIYFSDRPERIFGESSTQTFLDGFGFTPVDPPNAALVVEGDGGGSDVVIVELVNPTYDASNGNITYEATVLEAYDEAALDHASEQLAAAEIPETFGRASLFIDGCATFNNCITWDPNFDVLGPIPDGPYPACYSSAKGCVPCDTSVTFGQLAGLCGEQYPACKSSGGCLPSG